METKQLFTRREMASILRVHVETIKQWERKGLLSRCNTIGRPRYDAGELDRLTNKKTIQQHESNQPGQ